MNYASQTTVSVEKSKGELERLLTRAGAAGFVSGFEGNVAMVGFKLNDRFYSIRFKLPDQSDFSKTPAGRRRRSALDMLKFHEQACRAKWRAIVLIVHGKLEGVAQGIMTVEEAFATDLVLGNGKTVGECVLAAVKDGRIPKALPLT